jgi:segregation and condensation protein B
LEEAEKQAIDSDVDVGQEENRDKTQNDLVLVEAALYVAGHPLDMNELCSVLKTRSKTKTRKMVEKLIRDYLNRNTAIEILELKDERFVMQLKSDFTPHVKRFVNRPLLSVGPLKTLSYIAYRQPVVQKRVVDVRGHHAYGHIKELRDMGLIASERNGRSMLLRTTEYFADYFGLSQDTGSMKRELKHVFENFPKVENSRNEDG